ncbi:pituitary tumor-transforming gene 1 protein-interacting protein-like [Sycon ciliatum]|uniref:pituitary tumor-transforming gene 1 protein-interacting protein-like n=1 Tax=Sycon ciliatum TaxID=27933 RepID=UPI0020A841A3
MTAMKFLAFAVLAACCVLEASAASNCTTRTSCKDCVKSFGCYWCEAFKSQGKTGCNARTTFQLTTPCPDKYYLYPTCKLTGLTLLILVAVVVGLVVILFGVMIYCCCCRSGSSSRFRRENERDRTNRADRTRRQEERRQERQSRIDDIRKKYGLGTEDRYQKM